MLTRKCETCYLRDNCVDYCEGEEYMSNDKYDEAIRKTEMEIVYDDIGWHSDDEWWLDPQ